MCDVLLGQQWQYNQIIQKMDSQSKSAPFPLQFIWHIAQLLLLYSKHLLFYMYTFHVLWLDDVNFISNVELGKIYQRKFCQSSSQLGFKCSWWCYFENVPCFEWIKDGCLIVVLYGILYFEVSVYAHIQQQISLKNTNPHKDFHFYQAEANNNI